MPSRWNVRRRPEVDELIHDYFSERVEAVRVPKDIRRNAHERQRPASRKETGSRLRLGEILCAAALLVATALSFRAPMPGGEVLSDRFAEREIVARRTETLVLLGSYLRLGIVGVEKESQGEKR